MRKSTSTSTSTKPTVCFLTPPSPFLLDARVFPALGILKVAAVAEQLHYPVEHLDLNGVENYEDAVLSHLAHTDARVFAITATTPQMVAVTKIRNVLRNAAPTAKIIIGGPHPTLVHAATRTNTERAESYMQQLLHDYDVVVVGDGEKAIELALQEDSPAVIDADDPKGSLFLTIQELGVLPLPARHLIELESYHYSIDDVRTTMIIGQLGCPMKCSFCGGRNSPMLRRMRLRKTDGVIDEIRHIYQTYGYLGYFFADDELNINREFPLLLNALGELQDELGVSMRFRGFLKSEFITEDHARLMREVGFRQVLCGFESGSDKILRNIRKNASKEENTRAMELSHKHDLGMKALMSIGHPGESPETIQESLDWILGVAPDQADFTVITPYPGSPYWNNAKHVKDNQWTFTDFGDNLHMTDIDYTEVETYYKGVPGAYQSFVFTDYMSKEDIVLAREHAEKSYRSKFSVPYYQSSAAKLYEHSLGSIPGWIFKKSE